MAVATAIDDARRFLYLHPEATTAVDNPVELLRAVVDEVEGTQANTDEPIGETSAEKLLAFVKRLRDEHKISEAEYREAQTLVD